MNKIKAFFAKIGSGIKKAAIAVKNFRFKNYHIVKRATITMKKAVLIRVITIVSSLLFCSILATLMIGADPIEFIRALFFGVFGSKGRIWSFAKGTAVLLMIALAITPAFKMRFWNIGAEGQTLIGALASVGMIMAFGDTLPTALLLPVMLVASVVVSGIWAGIPAIFKAKWNTNETLFTLMMNYIASGIVAYFLLVWTPSGSSVLGMLSDGHIPILGHEYLITVIVALLMTAFVYIYLKYSKHGYEIAVVGESENTAKYVGISVGKVIIRTMILSGILCGIAGFILVGAIDHSVSETTVGGLGFTAIMASWLAKFNPLVMIGTSAFIMFLDQGSAEISTNFNVDSSFPDIVVGIVLFFIIGCEFFVNYRIKRREAKKEVA